MKILHTSDWHLGKLLYRKKRYEEFEQFLLWLEATINAEHIDALLIAGDVFDTTTPSNRSLELYYHFLARVSQSCCRHIVVTAGNHDSPSLLNAPRTLLRQLHVHVVGNITGLVEDEVIVLRDGSGRPEMIVCAVPFLRDGDVRTSVDGETPDEKINKTLEGIRRHYAQVVEKAECTRAELKCNTPIFAMGHLFAAGGQRMEGDGVRELYIGNLAYVTAEVFPPCLEYVALGHLHKPQLMDKSETRRYCGSPLPMGFGEADQQKHVIVVDTSASPCTVRTIDIPCFQKLRQIRGNWRAIAEALQEVRRSEAPHWLEIIYDGDDLPGNLQEHIDAVLNGSPHSVLAAIDLRHTRAIAGGSDSVRSLDELTEEEIFIRCLEANAVPEDIRPGLLHTFHEVLVSLHQNDPNAD